MSDESFHQDPARCQRVSEKAVHYFESVGLKTKVVSSPKATGLDFGLIVAWVQELERYCEQSGQDYQEITSFNDEVKFFPPVKYSSGLIGGHYVTPNIRGARCDLGFQPSESRAGNAKQGCWSDHALPEQH